MLSLLKLFFKSLIENESSIFVFVFNQGIKVCLILFFSLSTKNPFTCSSSWVDLFCCCCYFWPFFVRNNGQPMHPLYCEMFRTLFKTPPPSQVRAGKEIAVKDLRERERESVCVRVRGREMRIQVHCM